MIWRTRWNPTIGSRQSPFRTRLGLTSLEDRAVPAALVVTDAGDSGMSTQLRQIMAQADSNGQDDTITFAGGITAINLVSGQISLTTQNNLLTIDGGGVVSINGAGTASATNRIFNFNVSAGNPTITLKDLTLANGNLTSGNNGGAILINNDPLVLNNVTFKNNITAGGGGAIATTSSVAANISITNGSFSGNSAGTVAGGIFGLSTLTLNVNGTTVSNNTANTTGGFLQTNGTSSVTINSASFTNNVSSTGGTGAAVIQNGGASSVWNISNSNFTGNQALAGGAGVMNSSSASTTFNFSNCNFSTNFANNGPGGALRIGGSGTSLNLDSCIVSGNTAASPGTGGTGGGIFFYPLSGNGSISITNSTISGNLGAGNGAGVYIKISGASTAVITNTTISGNMVTNGISDGGGVAITAGLLTINNSTIFGNSAGSSTGSGGGIRKLQPGGLGAVTLNSTIVAGNSASGIDSDISSSATVPFTIGGGHNVIGVADVGGFSLSGANRSGTAASPLDAKLNALGNNGGPTATHSLKADSPAINFGTNGLGLPNDQRGATYPRVNDMIPDVGAFEGTTFNPGAKATLANVPPAGGTYIATVVYTDETGINTSSIDTSDVLLSGPGYAGSVSPTLASFTGSGTSVTATYTFNPPGGAWDWTDNGVYTLTMQPSQVLDTDGSNSVPAGVLEVLNVTMPLPNPLVVDNSGDSDDGNFAVGQLTLREAVRLANITAGQPDSITFDAGLSGQTIAVGSQIFITDAVSITGLGAANSKLSGGDLNRVLGVNLTNASDSVTLNQLTIANGATTDGMGGAITVDSGNLTLSKVVLDSNKSTPSKLAGGGAVLFNTAAKLTLNDCTVTNNVANGSSSAPLAGGGAINCLSGATVTINNSIFSNNSSSLDFGGVIRGQGSVTLTVNDSKFENNSALSGGVLYANNCTVTLNRSTVSGNTSTGTVGAGGAIYCIGTSTFDAKYSTFSNNSSKNGGAVSIRGGNYKFTNCTLSANSASGTGGGAINLGLANSNLTLNNCTVFGNAASNGAGGGIFKSFTTGAMTVTLNSSIVAGNTSFQRGPDMDFGATTITATTINGGKNLIGISDVGNFVLSGINKTGTNATPLDPLLEALANNGGPTLTHALKAGSPAFDNGSNPSTLQYDQRGAGHPRSLQTAVDVGAFEGFNPVPTYTGTLADVPPVNPTYKTSVTYTSPVGINTGSIDIDDARLSGPGFGMTPATPNTATVTSGQNGDKSVTVEYVFTPPGGTWDYTDDGSYALNVQDNQVYDTNAIPLAAVGGQVDTMLVAIPLPVMIVDNADDIDDGDYSAGQFTLREAINRANKAISTSDTIMFAPSLVGGQTITVSSELAISDPLTIIGPGAANLTISGGGMTKIFSTSIPTINSPVSLSGLTISNGFAPGGSAMVIAAESVTLNDCVISNNANTNPGGAIYLLGTGVGSLTVNNCVFDANYSTGGGAITVQAGAGLFVNNCLFTNNATTKGNTGGAIRYIGTTTMPVNVAIRNSTFTGNQTQGSGGAIGFVTVFLGTALVQNCTITGNTADTDDNGDADGGGIGVFTGQATGKVVIDSCIVSGNFKGIAVPVASDLQNSSNGNLEANFSLIGSTSAAMNFVPDAKTTSLLGQNPMLDVLANNGGPTLTMALLPGSPAIDNGSNSAVLNFDARGNGFSRTVNKATDIGAYEVQNAVALPTVTAIQINDGAVQRSMVTSIKVTFSEAVAFPSGINSAFTLTRTTAPTGGTLDVVNVSAVQSGNSVTLTFLNGGSVTIDPAGSLPDGKYTLNIVANRVAGIGGFLDGNMNGTFQGSPIDDKSATLYRLFGDANGDGAVNSTGFAALRTVFGVAGPVFDFDGNGVVNSDDFAEFRKRFGLSI